MERNESCEHGKYSAVCSRLIVEFVEKLIDKSVRVGEFPRYKGYWPNQTDTSYKQGRKSLLTLGFQRFEKAQSVAV
jgi:hypothetical protein